MLRLPRPVKISSTVAIFDCGTNTILLLVARRKPDGKVTALHQAVASPRLGAGLSGRGKLNPKAVVRTLLTLIKLRKQAARYKPDCFLALGTNIYRRAGNGKTAARLFEKKLGLPFFILSAADEARLEFWGAASGLKTKAGVVVVDVGGGSSEVIWGRSGKITNQISLEIGAVRLKETFPVLRNCNPEILRNFQAEAAKKVAKLKPKNVYPLAVLTGGTATTLAAFSLGQKKYRGEKVHGFQTAPKKLQEVVEKLARLPLSNRRKVLSFDPARTDIIVPGGIILLEILKRLGVKKVVISDHGLRWGAAYLYFS